VPTILKAKGYRFFFYSNDHSPIHIHVEKGGKTAKFDLNPVILSQSSKFNAKELKEIRTLVQQNQTIFKSKWDAFFDHH
jgi:hypothetical protein